MIVNVSIERIVRASPGDAAEVRSFRSAIAAVVEQHVRHALLARTTLSPSIPKLGERVAAAVVPK